MQNNIHPSSSHRPPVLRTYFDKRNKAFHLFSAGTDANAYFWRHVPEKGLSSKPSLTLKSDSTAVTTAISVSKDRVFVGDVAGMMKTYSMKMMEKLADSEEDMCIKPISTYESVSDDFSRNSKIVSMDIDNEEERLLYSVAGDVFIHPLNKSGFLRNRIIENSVITSVSWIDSTTFAVGTFDGRIMICDVRKIQSELQTINTFSTHRNDVSRIHRCPQNKQYFASSSLDKTVIVWDIKDRSSRHSFVTRRSLSNDDNHIVLHHFGHQAAVLDVQWNPIGSQKYTLASVSPRHEDPNFGDLQIYRPHGSLFE